MNDKKIIIRDWANNLLFVGDCDSVGARETIKKNIYLDNNGDIRTDEITIEWADKTNTENVWEYIDF